MPRGVYKHHPNQGFQKGHKSTHKFKKGNQWRFKKGHPQSNTGRTHFKKGEHLEENNWNWKNGKRIIGGGYIVILQPFHPRADNMGYVKRSYLIIEKYLKRFLKKGEIVHHRNKIRNDDRPINLMAFISLSAHQRFHHNPDNVKSKEIIFDGRKIKRR